MRWKKKKRRRKQTEKRTLEVSILGGGFDRFLMKEVRKIPPGNFCYVKLVEKEEELLVKVRGVSSRETEKEIESIRPAPPDEVVRVMKKMVRAYLWEKGYDDIKIADAKLDLKVGSILFVYVAEKKHNLTKIAPKLAKNFHVRVDFKQIGARDYARCVGGLGQCGRTLCCKIFLKEIPSVTLDMARNQYVFAAPERLSGICGRLLCCLRFELPVYEELLENLPPLGSKVETHKGIGTVIEINAVLGRFKIQYENDGVETILKEDPVEWRVLEES